MRKVYAVCLTFAALEQMIFGLLMWNSFVESQTHFMLGVAFAQLSRLLDEHSGRTA